MADMAFPAMSVVRGKDILALNWVIIGKRTGNLVRGVLGFMFWVNWGWGKWRVKVIIFFYLV